MTRQHISVEKRITEGLETVARQLPPMVVMGISRRTNMILYFTYWNIPVHKIIRIESTTYTKQWVYAIIWSLLQIGDSHPQILLNNQKCILFCGYCADYDAMYDVICKSEVQRRLLHAWSRFQRQRWRLPGEQIFNLEYLVTRTTMGRETIWTIMSAVLVLVSTQQYGE